MTLATIITIITAVALLCCATLNTDKPRHGRDYRFRTPANLNYLQNISGSYCPANVIQVNATGANELTWDFDTPIANLADGANLRYASFTGPATGWQDLFDSSIPPIAVTDHSDQVTAGQSRIVCTYTDPIDPATTCFLFQNTGPSDTTFVTRPNPADYAGPIATP